MSNNAGKKHHLSLSLDGVLPAAHEAPKLFGSPDQRCCTLTKSLETTSGRTECPPLAKPRQVRGSP